MGEQATGMLRKSMRGTPKTVLVWGAALAVGGAAFTILVPWIFFSITGPEGQFLADPVSRTVSLIREIVVPLGTSFVAASIVMGLLQQNPAVPRHMSITAPARAMLLIGIGAGLLSVVLTFLVPLIPENAWFAISIAEQHNSLAVLLEAIIQILSDIAPFLAAALIAGALVVGYAAKPSRETTTTQRESLVTH